MNSKVNNVSIALVSSNNDVALFLKGVLSDEFGLELFSGFQIARLLVRSNDFDCVFVDMQAVFCEKDEGQWKNVFKIFKERIFILTERPDGGGKSFGAPKVISYPFNKNDIAALFGKKGEPPPSQKARKKEADLFKMVPEFSRLLGSCERLNDTKRKIMMVADIDTPLVFLGESGTGKSMAAKIVHDISRRRDKPFVIANMANGNKELFESILFGNVRGAFTDAKNRDGLFKKADGGTLFMDEIAELSLDCQAKLLRVIETGLFRPVGCDEEFQSDVRLIFATNADLRSMVEKNLFREDLYWRIVDFPIVVPSLRERRDDFPLLVENELMEIKRKWAMSFSITQAAVDKITECDWPGNYRQFKSCLRRAAILSRDTGVIDADAISF